jgi:hypothetical protein
MNRATLFLLNALFYSGVLFSQSSLKDTAHLESTNLKVVIANNNAYGPLHKAGYSGIAELYFKKDGDSNLFVPFYAGLNFEHIFSGDSASYEWNMYECRQAPMDVVRVARNKVELRQVRTKNWPLKTSISYALNGDAIDFEFKGMPLADLWKKNKYIGIFFASYINNPDKKGINFIARQNNGKAEWIYHLPAEHGKDAVHRPDGNHWDPSIDTAGFPISLVGAYSSYTYVYPFYYGVSGDNVFIMMFDNYNKDAAHLNFTQSPDGGGDYNPAWDFIYFQKKYSIGKQFSFRARAVFKKFEGKEDVIRLYEKWSGRKVKI